MKRQLTYQRSPSLPIEERTSLESLQETVATTSALHQHLQHHHRNTLHPHNSIPGTIFSPQSMVRVLSTPITLKNGTNCNSSNSTSSFSLEQQRRLRRSNMRSSPTKLGVSKTRSFDDHPPHPIMTNIPIRHYSASGIAGIPILKGSPTLSISTAGSTAPISSSSSTTSVSSNEENESLYRTRTPSNLRSRRGGKERPPLHRSISSDDSNDSTHWMNSLVTTTITEATKSSTSTATGTTMIDVTPTCSPPQEMKITSVRKRPSPRNPQDTSSHNHNHNDENCIPFDYYHGNSTHALSNTSSVHKNHVRSKPTSMTTLQQQQQLQQRQHQGTPLPLPAPSSSNSVRHHGISKSASFRRRKGNKAKTTRNPNRLFRYYIIRQCIRLSKQKSLIYMFFVLLMILFVLSFSLSFLGSNYKTMTRVISFPDTIRSIDEITTPSTSTISNNKFRMIKQQRGTTNVIQKPWKLHSQEQSKGNSQEQVGSSPDRNNPNQTEQQQQKVSPSISTNQNTGIIRTLRGRFKKQNIITNMMNKSSHNQQQPHSKKNPWFGFSHLLMPPKNAAAVSTIIARTGNNDTLSSTTTTTTLRRRNTPDSDTGMAEPKKQDDTTPSLRLGDKTYNFQQYTKFAPQCDNDDKSDVQVNDIDFTMTTQLSYNRLWMMEYHCLRWTHAMSLAIYIGHNTTITSQSIRDELIEMGCNEKQSIAIQTLSGYSDEEYPVNILRNMALSKVQTTHVVYVDVDFWISDDLYNILSQHRDTLLSNSKLALVIPAFQLSRQCKEWRDCRELNIPKMPHSKDELVDLMVNHQANAFDPSNRGGHGSTRYKDWLVQAEDELIPIDCVKSNRYEPYLVFRLCSNLPPFQESFTGYGKNKMTWMMQLRRTGYQLMQLGGAYVIHYPHLDSTARMHWNGGIDGTQLPKPQDKSVDLSKFKRGQIDETFVAFRNWLGTTIPDQTIIPMCHDAQDDDQRLWIDPAKVVKTS